MRLLKWGEGRFFSVQLEEKQYLARNWLRFAKGRRSPQNRRGPALRV